MLAKIGGVGPPESAPVTRQLSKKEYYSESYYPCEIFM